MRQPEKNDADGMPASQQIRASTTDYREFKIASRTFAAALQAFDFAHHGCAVGDDNVALCAPVIGLLQLAG